jgi:hypothetical protein
MSLSLLLLLLVLSLQPLSYCRGQSLAFLLLLLLFCARVTVSLAIKIVDDKPDRHALRKAKIQAAYQKPWILVLLLVPVAGCTE